MDCSIHNCPHPTFSLCDGSTACTLNSALSEQKFLHSTRRCSTGTSMEKKKEKKKT